MPWVKIDDHYAEHPKLARVGPLGVALWLAALAYCNRNLTDGFIPWSIAHSLVSWDFLVGEARMRLYLGSADGSGAPVRLITEDIVALLLDVGLWDFATGGYRVHDFDNYQPTRAQIIAERERKAAAGSAGGLATAKARAKAPAVAQSKPVPVPVPFKGSPVVSVDARARPRRNEVQEQIRDAIIEKYGEGEVKRP